MNGILMRGLHPGAQQTIYAAVASFLVSNKLRTTVFWTSCDTADIWMGGSPTPFSRTDLVAWPTNYGALLNAVASTVPEFSGSLILLKGSKCLLTHSQSFS